MDIYQIIVIIITLIFIIYFVKLYIEHIQLLKLKTIVGNTAVVYNVIPSYKKGIGMIYYEKYNLLYAITDNTELIEFTKVKIISVINKNTVLVRNAV